MSNLHRRSDTWLGGAILLSLIVHGAALVLFIWIQQLTPNLDQVHTTYYVDVVNLPVASPQSGSPSPAPAAEKQQLATAPQTGPPAEPQPAAAATSPATTGKATPSKTTTTSQTAAKSFQERLAKLQGKADAEREAATLESLRRKVAGGRAGMPGASGSQAGSDYTAYLHSRLKDAFRETISYQTKAPFVVVRLTIDGNGRIIRILFDHSSGDRLFEKSVQRAILLAEQRIVPPPNHSTYEGAFVFKPQGVVQR